MNAGIVGVSALLEQPSGYARAKGIKVCDRWLRQHGLPGTRKHKLRWPAIIPRHVFSSCLHDIRLCLLKTYPPLLASWIIKTVQAVSSRRPNYTKLWKHIAVCKGTLSTDLFNKPPGELDISSKDGLQGSFASTIGKPRSSKPGPVLPNLLNLQCAVG